MDSSSSGPFYASPASLLALFPKAPFTLVVLNPFSFSNHPAVCHSATHVLVCLALPGFWFSHPLILSCLVDGTPAEINMVIGLRGAFLTSSSCVFLGRKAENPNVTFPKLPHSWGSEYSHPHTFFARYKYLFVV